MLATSDDYNATGIQIIKRFGKSELTLGVKQVAEPYAGGIQDQLILARGSVELTIGLDLFEFILRSADGLMPGAFEHRALFEDLRSFKNKLLAEPARDLVILGAGRRQHHVFRSEANKITLEQTP